MAAQQYTESDLEAFLEEALSAEGMAAIERALRSSPELTQLLSRINGRRDAGVHTLGEIWRRNRISCPTREQMGSFLLGVIDESFQDYIQFHLEVVACRFCTANLEDLKRQQAESSKAAESRRQKYFQSSAGYLRK